jgi:hypothetical protein
MIQVLIINHPATSRYELAAGRLMHWRIISTNEEEGEEAKHLGLMLKQVVFVSDRLLLSFQSTNSRSQSHCVGDLRSWSDGGGLIAAARVACETLGRRGQSMKAEGWGLPIVCQWY